MPTEVRAAPGSPLRDTGLPGSGAWSRCSGGRLRVNREFPVGGRDKKKWVAGVSAVYVQGRSGSIEVLCFLPKEKVKDSFSLFCV